MPHTINRKATKIEETSKWKSSEIRNFLFFLSLPILISFLPSSYFYKFASYVIVIRILYEPIKNLEDLDVSEAILVNYIKDLEDTFSIQAYTFTIHAHLHLVDQVRLHGPLQCHSAFFFEGALSNIKNLLHGSKGFLNQITKQLFLFKNLRDNIHAESFLNDELRQFILKKLDNIENNRSELIGTANKRNLNLREKDLLYKNFNLDYNCAVISDRAKIEGKIFHSKLYSRKGACNSYSVSYIKNNRISYCDIEYFIELYFIFFYSLLIIIHVS